MSETAGISSRAALSTSAGILHAPSRIENSEWTWRWTNGELTGGSSYCPRGTVPDRADRHVKRRPSLTGGSRRPVQPRAQPAVLRWMVRRSRPDDPKDGTMAPTARRKRIATVAGAAVVAVVGGIVGAALYATTQDGTATTVTVTSSADGTRLEHVHAELDRHDRRPGRPVGRRGRRDARRAIRGRSAGDPAGSGLRVRLRHEGAPDHERSRRRGADSVEVLFADGSTYAGDRRRHGLRQRRRRGRDRRTRVLAARADARRLVEGEGRRRGRRRRSPVRPRQHDHEPASSARSTARSPHPTRRRSRARSRPTRRSTTATPAGRCSMQAGRVIGVELRRSRATRAATTASASRFPPTRSR